MSGWDYFSSGASHLKRRADSLHALTDQDSIKQSIQSAIVLTSSFYVCTKSFQRLAGAMSIHSGRPLVASSFGFVSVAISSLLAFQINEASSEILASKKFYPNFSMENLQKIVLDDRISATLFAYTLLERKSLLTAVPSSVITIGVHAKHGNFLGMFRGSVISSDITATPKERYEIQKLGKRLVLLHVLLDWSSRISA
jgi:Co/Zn/Cd efflux system component